MKWRHLNIFINIDHYSTKIAFVKRLKYDLLLRPVLIPTQHLMCLERTNQSLFYLCLNTKLIGFSHKIQFPQVMSFISALMSKSKESAIEPINDFPTCSST